jgi:hypothetical protein
VSTVANDEQLEFGVLPPSLAIDSMRKNGYLTTDMAIAELIDNSVDAQASRVELLLFENEVQFENLVSRIIAVGVLDNGEGMDSAQLRRSLQFGGGSRAGRDTIGRFGFGLPNSSISQANRVEVWSWKNGPENALCAYLDVREIREGHYSHVPTPERRPLPQRVRQYSDEIGPSGTYVEWTDLDEDITWKRGRTVVKHTEMLVGRIYRHYLRRDINPLSIRMVVVGSQGDILSDLDVRVTDPLYLMADTSCPWPDEPMFQLFTDEGWTFRDKNGQDRNVRVRISYAKPECRQQEAGLAAGSQEHGKHANRNLGVSIVRSNRELQLENAIHADPYLDRWWGVEISFPAELDELFGVSNNKQGANTLVEALKTFDADNSLTVTTLVDQGDLDRHEDRIELYKLAQWVNEQVRSVMRLIKKQREGERSEDITRHGKPAIEDRASEAIKRRAAERSTEEEEQEKEHPTDPAKQIEAGQKALEEEGYSPADARAIMEAALDRDRKVIFVESHPGLTGDAVFEIRPLPGGRVELVFNVNHPAHQQIFETLGGHRTDMDTDSLRQRLDQAADSLKLLFTAWTRMELEARQGKERSAYARVRSDWGRMAADFLDPSFASALSTLGETEGEKV